MNTTISELKAQRRWVVWRLETVNKKLTKVPYQPKWRKAMANKLVLPPCSTQDLARTMQLCMDLGGTRLYIVLLSALVGFNPFSTMGGAAIRFPASISHRE